MSLICFVWYGKIASINEEFFFHSLNLLTEDNETGKFENFVNWITAICDLHNSSTCKAIDWTIFHVYRLLIASKN